MVEQDAPAGLGGPSAGQDPAVGAFPFGPEGQALEAGDVEQAVDAAGAQVQAGVEGGLGPFEGAIGLIEGGVGIQPGQEAALGVEGGGSGAIEGIATPAIHPAGSSVDEAGGEAAAEDEDQIALRGPARIRGFRDDLGGVEHRNVAGEEGEGELQAAGAVGVEEAQGAGIPAGLVGAGVGHEDDLAVGQASREGEGGLPGGQEAGQGEEGDHEARAEGPLEEQEAGQGQQAEGRSGEAPAERQGQEGQDQEDPGPPIGQLEIADQRLPDHHRASLTGGCGGPRLGRRRRPRKDRGGAEGAPPLSLRHRPPSHLRVRKGCERSP
jgi:hypothetical protein